MLETDFKQGLDRYHNLASASQMRGLGSVSNIARLEPILTDDTPNSQAGTFTGHYFHQDLVVANYIFKRRPALHVDIGSRVDGFISHLLAFEQQTLFGDIRPIESSHASLETFVIDLAKPLPEMLSGKFNSVSSLHAVEHIGLGRYGDNINPEGHIKAITNLKDMLTPYGFLYLSFPTGPSRVEFNSQRVLSIEESLNLFSLVGLIPKELRIVDDKGLLIPTTYCRKNSWGMDLKLYAGCAIWTLQSCSCINSLQPIKQ